MNRARLAGLATRRFTAHDAPPCASAYSRKNSASATHRPLELVDQHALVRRVDVREAVRRAEQQDLGVGHRLLQRADERDRAAGRDDDGLVPQAVGERGAGGLVGRARRWSAEKPLPVSAGLDLERDPERPQRLEVRGSSVAWASSGSCSGWMRRLSFARAYGTTALTARVDRQRVEAGHGDRRP